MEARPLILAAMLAPCALASNPTNVTPLPRVLNTHFTYKATVPAAPPGAKKLDLWLPIPSDGPYQKVTDLRVESPAPYRVTRESKFGNRMVFVEANSGPLEVTVSFDVARTEISLAASSGVNPRTESSLWT